MGKKTMSESSSAHSHKKISKNRDKKPQLNNSSLQIKFMKPKVYITDSWNFKSLVQELTGNNNGSSPVSSPRCRRPVQHPVPVPVPVIDDLEDHAYYHESAVDLSFDSSEASAPTSLETHSTAPCMQQPDFNMLESWLLETTTTADTYYDHHHRRHRYDDAYVPLMVQEEDVSVYDYDLSFSYEDYPVHF